MPQRSLEPGRSRAHVVRHRWRLDQGGRVDVLDLGFGVLTAPEGHAARLLDEILPAQAHYDAVVAEEGPDLISR